MKNKKGISAVVATVLIILITVAAVTIIWAAIVPMLGKLDSVGACSDASMELTLKSVCTDGTDLNVQLESGSDLVLADVQVIVYDANGDSETLSLIDDTTAIVADIPGANEMKTFTILDGDITMASASIAEVAIAPIVSVSGTTETCDALAPIVIRDC